jgi:hypothetical protein
MTGFSKEFVSMCDCSDCKAYRKSLVCAPAQDNAAPTTFAGGFAAFPADPPTLLPGMSSDKRKEYPLVTGCIDYFPDALLAVAHISFLGNQQHNPGKPLHWNRAKSSDEMDAMGRHITERGTFNEVEAFVDAQVAWRALANLQKTLEKMYGLPLPRGCTPAA